MAETCVWRQSLLKALKERNRCQVEVFQGIIDDYNRLFESADALRQNVAQPRAPQRAGALEATADSASALAAANGRVQELEQKRCQLQEELTDLLRRRGENAQMIVDLNTELAQARQQLAICDQRLAESVAETETLKERIVVLEQQNSELQATNQTLKDEHHALQLVYDNTEKNMKTIQGEHDALVARWMELKSKDAEKMNAENEMFVRRRQQQREREIEEATREVVVVPPDTVRAPVCLSASLPSKCITSFDAHESEVNAVCWSPSGRLLASGGGDRKVKLWTIRRGQHECINQYAGSNKAINSVAFDDEENLILAAGNDLASRVWGVSDSRLKYTLTGHSKPVMVAKFQGGPTKVITGSRDHTLKHWDLFRGGDCVLTIFASSMCFDIVDGVGSNLLSGHFDGTVKVWDLRSPREPKHTINVDALATSLALGSDYKVLCCTRGDELKIIDLRTLSVVKRFQADGFHVGCDFSRAVFSPDFKYVAAGSGSGDLFIWNTGTQLLEKQLRCPAAQPSCILTTAWHPEGSYLVSSDKNRLIAVWSDV